MTLGQGYDRLGYCFTPYQRLRLYNGQGYDTHLGYGLHLCEVLSRSNMAVRSYGQDTDFGYVCNLTLTLEI